MKITTSIFLAAAVAIGGGFFANHLSHVRAVHAQNACDATSFSGAYGYSLSGSAYNQDGDLLLLASAGRLVADGKGSITGGDTFSLDGTIIRRTYTGSYSMNGDCTGTVTLQIAAGSASGAAHGDIVAVNNNREINFIQTDTDNVFSGVLTRQNQ